MAEFCHQCTESVLGIDGAKNDLKGLVPKGMFVDVICEGCGFVVVDHAGKCVSPDCEDHGGKTNERN